MHDPICRGLFVICWKILAQLVAHAEVNFTFKFDSELPEYLIACIVFCLSPTGYTVEDCMALCSSVDECEVRLKLQLQLSAVYLTPAKLKNFQHTMDRCHLGGKKYDFLSKKKCPLSLSLSKTLL